MKHTCGAEMLATRLSKHSPAPANRNRPVWVCSRCSEWVGAENDPTWVEANRSQP